MTPPKGRKRGRKPRSTSDADEIRLIVESDPSRVRNYSGDTPYSAVPFSSAGAWNNRPDRPPIGADHDRLELARRINPPTLSDDPDLEQLMQAPLLEEPADNPSRVPLSHRLADALATLTPIEQEVMLLVAEGHYTSGTVRPHGTADIALMVNRHRTSVSQIVNRATDKLRAALEGEAFAA